MSIIEFELMLIIRYQLNTLTPHGLYVLCNRKRCMVSEEKLNAQGIKFTGDRLALIRGECEGAPVSNALVGNMAGNGFHTKAYSVAKFVQHGLLAALQHSIDGGAFLMPMPTDSVTGLGAQAVEAVRPVPVSSCKKRRWSRMAGA